MFKYFRLNNYSQTGAGQLLMVLLLLIGLVVGTYVVQNRTSILPRAAEPPTQSGCSKVSLTSRTEQELSDGRLEITFTWENGAKTYDYKTPKKADGDRTLIASQSKGVNSEGKGITKSGGEKRSGNTITQNWSDGSVQYNTVSAGTNHQGIAGERIDVSYMLVPGSKGGSCGPSNQTGSGQSGSNSSNKNNSDKNKTKNKPLSNQSTNGPDSNNSARTSNTGQSNTAATTVNTSATTAVSFVTQFQSLQNVFNQSVVVKVASNSATLDTSSLARINSLVTKTNQSLLNGLQAAQSCATAPTTTCTNALGPLLNFSLVAVRLTAFSALFADVPEICSRADFGINPPINGVSSTGVNGPIYICSGSNGKEKKWRIFDNTNTPLQLGADDNIMWPPLNDPATTAEFPQPFQAKFSEAVKLIDGTTTP